MAVLAGNHPEACFAKYASVPLRGKHCHEMALRIILSTISSHAARYKRYIVPMVSCSIDFYSRVFVRVYTSALEVKKAGSKLSTVYSCTGCGSYTLSPLLKVCVSVRMRVLFLFFLSSAFLPLARCSNRGWLGLHVLSFC